MKFALLTILSLLLTSEMMAQRPFQLLNAEISIAGTSNIHDWVSTTDRVNVSGTYDWGTDQALGISALRVTIPVATIKSSKGRIMDNKTYDALQVDQYPNIVFVLRDITESKATSLTAKGALTIAGKTKVVQLMVDRRVDAKGVLTFSGTKALKMTDFGVAPPTALLGTLKTGDDVSVTFTLRFQVDPEVTGRR